MFAPVGRQGDAGGLEDASDQALDMGARGNALAVFLDGCLLQSVEIADQVVPLDRHVGGAAAVGQFLLEHQRQEGTEDVAADLRPIAVLYAIEADIRGSPPERRLTERQKRSAPLVEAFGDWLRQQLAHVSPKSRLGEKLAYIARQWDGLQKFLADGRVEMDSNAVENLARPIALNRKNALFACHDEGAAAWARIASLIETAKLNGVEPYAGSRPPSKPSPTATRTAASTNFSLGTSTTRQAGKLGGAFAALTAVTRGD